MMSKPVPRCMGLAFLPPLVLLLCGIATQSTAFVVPAAPSSVSSVAGVGVGVGAGAAATASVPPAGVSGRRPRLAPLRVVWSNPQETEDYFRRIEGKEEKDKVGWDRVRG